MRDRGIYWNLVAKQSQSQSGLAPREGNLGMMTVDTEDDKTVGGHESVVTVASATFLGQSSSNQSDEVADEDSSLGGSACLSSSDVL